MKAFKSQIINSQRKRKKRSQNEELLQKEGEEHANEVTVFPLRKLYSLNILADGQG